MAHDHLNARSAGNVTLGGVGGPRDQRRDLLARLASAPGRERHPPYVGGSPGGRAGIRIAMDAFTGRKSRDGFLVLGIAFLVIGAVVSTLLAIIGALFLVIALVQTLRARA